VDAPHPAAATGADLADVVLGAGDAGVLRVADPDATQQAPVRASTYRSATADAMLERDLQAAVIGAAITLGWMYYHTHDSRRSPEGFPDLVLVKDERIIYAELKRQRGKATEKQQKWLAALTATGKAEVYLWRPSDLLDDTIITILRGKK
jgi:hypothetical protein